MSDFALNRTIIGDCRQTLGTLPEGLFQCCVTSPPYWLLRDYQHPDQIGMEEQPDAYVAALVAVFRLVRRTLRDDGTLWLNIGDSYAASAGGGQGKNSKFLDRAAARSPPSRKLSANRARSAAAGTDRRYSMRPNREQGEHETENASSCSGPNGEDAGLCRKD